MFTQGVAWCRVTELTRGQFSWWNGPAWGVNLIRVRRGPHRRTMGMRFQSPSRVKRASRYEYCLALGVRAQIGELGTLVQAR